MDDARVAQARGVSADARAFLFWSRMPLASFGGDGSATFADQRFTRAITRSTFTLAVPLAPPPSTASRPPARP
jgi:hypothetical protein